MRARPTQLEAPSAQEHADASVSSELMEAHATILKGWLAQYDTLLQQRMLEERSRRLNEQGYVLSCGA